MKAVDEDEANGQVVMHSFVAGSYEPAGIEGFFVIDPVTAQISLSTNNPYLFPDILNFTVRADDGLVQVDARYTVYVINKNSRPIVENANATRLLEGTKVVSRSSCPAGTPRRLGSHAAPSQAIGMSL